MFIKLLIGVSCALASSLLAPAALADEAQTEASNADAIYSIPPFSFVYNGVSSEKLLPNWKTEIQSEKSGEGKKQRVITYTDSATGLEIRCEATRFIDSPAVEWVLYATNKGATDTPILEHLLPLNLNLKIPAGELILHHSRGSQAGPLDFLPIDQTVPGKGRIDLAPNGGRSSDGNLPFFNLEHPGGGVVGAIGWTGQWAFHLERNDTQVQLEAGQQTVHMKLHPGETIRSPRILLVFWEGKDSLRGHNLLRQLLLKHYVPRINGEITMPPIALMTWFYTNEGNSATEENQKAAIKTAASMGSEAFWVDAGWFEGGWPAGAGSWVPKPEAFPNGLKPLGDEAHRQGMKFILWFEPERVTSKSRVAKEHPEWLLKHSQNPGFGSLYNLGDPAARVWLTDYLSKCIGDWGVDVFRNDFNIDPLRFWQAADAPDRQGMTENRYIEGLYAMWDELRAKHPGLTIDNCASGGRRLDLEMMSRSYPIWQSDTQCSGRAQPIQDQTQNAGLSLYIPLHSGGLWAFDSYRFRSMATTGLVICSNIGTEPDKLPSIRKMLEEVKLLRPLTLGDYYPLTEINTNDRFWCGWQYDRPDLGKGYVMAFRREKSPFTSANVPFRGLEAGADYRLTNVDTQEQKTVSGSVLTREFSFEISEPGQSVLFLYQKIKPASK